MSHYSFHSLIVKGARFIMPQCNLAEITAYMD